MKRRVVLEWTDVSEAIYTSEISVHSKTTLRYIPEDSLNFIPTRRPEILKCDSLFEICVDVDPVGCDTVSEACMQRQYDSPKAHFVQT